MPLPIWAIILAGKGITTGAGIAYKIARDRRDAKAPPPVPPRPAPEPPAPTLKEKLLGAKLRKPKAPPTEPIIIYYDDDGKPMK